eukprot:8852301-Lingulodinium_polyedra.AAC.1
MAAKGLGWRAVLRELQVDPGPDGALDAFLACRDVRGPGAMPPGVEAEARALLRDLVMRAESREEAK